MDKLSENFYNVIDSIVCDDCKRLSSTYFTDDGLESLSSEKEKKIFLLFKNIASLTVKFDKGVAEYNPGIIIYGEGRTFDLADMSEVDYILLECVDVKRLPLLLRARLSNILWNVKKNFSMAEIAIVSYHELYSILFDVENWTYCVKYIKHAIRLANKVRKGDLADKYIQELFIDVTKVNGSDKLFFSISVIEFLIECNASGMLQMIEVLDNIIKNSLDNIDKVEKAYELKKQIYNKENKKAAAKESQLQLAEYYEKVSVANDDVRSLYVAENILGKAIQIYKSEGKKEEQERATKKLLKVQKKIPKHMIPISVKADATKDYNAFISMFKNLNFEQAVVRLIQSVPIISKEDLEKRVLENATDPVACLFGMGVKNDKGQTVVNIPALDISNPKKDMLAFEMHMNQEALRLEECYGKILWWGISYIKENYQFEKSDLLFLVEDNPIIPEGRNQVLLSAIFYGLNGELFEALHILAPQMEKLFRTIAEECGSVMAELKKDFTVQEKLLTSIFDDEILWDCYDNNILFLFKGLLNEKSGANIRNEIAHGIMTSSKGNSAVAIYFYCLVLKVLSFTSKKCYRIIRDIKNKLENNEENGNSVCK